MASQQEKVNRAAKTKRKRQTQKKMKGEPLMTHRRTLFAQFTLNLFNVFILSIYYSDLQHEKNRFGQENQEWQVEGTKPRAKK